MDLSMGANFSITSASLSAFDTIAIIVLVPVYDRIIIPFLTRFNLQPTYLQRIGIGLVVSRVSSTHCCLRYKGRLFLPGGLICCICKEWISNCGCLCCACQTF